jgi:hypothetical protein
MPLLNSSLHFLPRYCEGRRLLADSSVLWLRIQPALNQADAHTKEAALGQGKRLGLIIIRLLILQQGKAAQATATAFEPIGVNKAFLRLPGLSTQLIRGCTGSSYPFQCISKLPVANRTLSFLTRDLCLFGIYRFS